MRPRLSYANVMSTLCFFLLLGGGAYAAKQLPKNSVGSPQIKKNAVKTGDIARNAVKVGKLAKEAVKAGKLAKNAVPTNRIRNNAVTGAKVNESTLSTVPSAQTANSIIPPEGWHEVGTPGEPALQNGWQNAGFEETTTAFYKDQEGVVHLRGTVENGGGLIFQLPAGYRPASGKVAWTPVVCTGGSCGPENGVGVAVIEGPGIELGVDGAVVPPNATVVVLDGTSFRAES